MKQIRNMAITGVDSQEKYNMVCDLVGDEGGSFDSSEIGLVMYDDGHSDYFMGFWDEQYFPHCTLYSYEDFIAENGEKKCDERWNGYYIPASQEAYDLLLADGHSGLPFYTEEDREKGYFNIHKGWFYLDPYADGILHTTFKGFLTTYLVRSLKPLYIVNGKLSATQYHPDEVAFKNKPEDFTITEDESFIVGTQYKHLKCDTVEWSKQNHTLEQQKAICQFMLNKHSMGDKGQDVEDIVKIKFYVNWLEEIAKAKEEK